MKTVKVTIKQLVADIKAKKSDEELMKAHGLTERNLNKLKRVLLARKLVTREEMAAQSGGKAFPKKSIDAEAFLADFRKQPDDNFLMNKYNLKPRHLKKVYDSLMRQGFIEEYEYHTRIGKADELNTMEVAPPAASALIESLENPGASSSKPRREVPLSDDGLPNTFFEDQTGRRLGDQNAPGPPPDLRGSSTVVDVVSTQELCPRCGERKDPNFSSNRCPKCGAVYAKPGGR